MASLMFGLFEKKVCVGAVFALLLFAACSPVVDTPESGMLETIVAATIQALPTQTPLPTETMTLAATNTRVSPTPTETQTPLPTLTPVPTWTDTPTETPTPNPTSPSGPEIGKRQGDSNFACIVLSRSPVGDYKASPGQDVSVSWRIRNSGSRDWRTDSIDYGYVSGEKMSTEGGLFDLRTTVTAGQEGNITVLFEAPKNAGTYLTTWSLYRGSNAFCKFSFTIIVE
jgi:hypothetical protein